MEELVDIGLLKVEGKGDEANQVTRQLRVSTLSNCKLLYMTSSAFFKIFGKYELEKMKEFTEKVDLSEIETRVRNIWFHKQRLTKRIHEAVVDTNNRENRMKPWMNKVQSKKHNLPEVMLEDRRIKVIETRVTVNYLDQPQEYNADLNEKEKEAVLKAMIEQEQAAAARYNEDDDYAESSIGRRTSRLDSHYTASKPGHETFNILPQPNKLAPANTGRQ